MYPVKMNPCSLTKLPPFLLEDPRRLFSTELPSFKLDEDLICAIG